MTQLVSDFLLHRLSAWGVKRIFGYPGDGINGLLGALERAAERFEFVQVRHEEMSAFMACAHAKFTGDLGVCLATSGPGAVHLLNGLYDAKRDHQPVVAIVGQQPRSALGSDFLQEIDLQALFKDVASEFVQMVTVPEQVRHVVDRAVRTALSERTVTCVIVPNDLQEMDAVPQPPHTHGANHSGIGFSRPRIVPAAEDLERAAQVLNEGERVAILVGAGALHATDEVIEVAELLGAGVSKALLGLAVVPDDLSFVCGSIGLLGTKPSWELMRGCDTLFMIGSGFPYSEFLPKEGQARGVQIDIDGRMLSIRYPMEVNLVGDSRETLRELVPYLTRKTQRQWREKIENDVLEWRNVLKARAMHEANPINPQRVFWELSARLPNDCILTADSGSGTNWYARDIQFKRGQMGSVSGGMASMGCAVPYAIAAKFAHPQRLVVALAGDGAMQMNGNAELITIAKYWRQWCDPRLIVLVLNNRDLNQVTWEQRVLSGDPKYEASQSLPDFPYARYAELTGLLGIRVDEPGAICAAWDQALGADQPVVLEAYTDPNTPPLPPHVKFEQARAYMSALLKGDSQTRGILEQSAKEVVEGLIPRRRQKD